MLDVRNLSFSYTEKPVLNDISFSAARGSCTAIIGESGCGKSTLLKLLYGIHDADTGEILFNGNRINGPKFNLVPGAENMKYLAQDFGLMPYITVAENVGKHLSNIYKQQKQERISELLEMVGMSAFANVKAQFLSGGQQQRTALAMVLALEPELLLLDEPFSQIDNFRVNDLRRSVFRYLKQKKITCIMATHDASDVLSFSDQVMAMRDGQIVALGSPDEIYHNPENAYVGSLFGEVSTLNFEGISKKYFRPHELEASPPGIPATVEDSYFCGSHFLIEAASVSSTIFFNSQRSYQKGEAVFIRPVMPFVKS